MHEDSSAVPGPGAGRHAPADGALRRARAAGLGMLGVAFLAGGLGGYALGRRTPPGGSPPPMGQVVAAPEPAPTMMAGPAEILPPILEAIGATAAQRAEIDRILERRRPQTEALLRQTLPGLRAITDSTDREIRAVLTPEQRAKLDRFRVDPALPPASAAPGAALPSGTAPAFPAPPGDTTRVLPAPGGAPPAGAA